jgi:ureidoglycolate lyase
MPSLPMGSRLVLQIEPLAAATFAPFGDVIEVAVEARRYSINQGYAERFHDLARIDTGGEGGQTLVSIFRARPRTLPFRLSLVERHRLGSQAFMPLSRQRFLVVVAVAGPVPRGEQLRCFVAASGQGVNYAAGVWHHPLLAIDAGGDFLVIDRGGQGAASDCEEHVLDEREVWIEG